MKPQSRRPGLAYFAGLFTLFALAACEGRGEQVERPIERDWAAIQARDTISLLTAYNSTGYFVYRGEPMGFEYELLQAFAKEHDLVLNTEVVANRDELLDRLARGDGDVGAARLMPARTDRDRIAFTRGLYSTRPVLVQQAAGVAESNVPAAVDTILTRRAPASGGADDAETPLRARLISRPDDLAGEKVYTASSTYLDRLVEISDSISGDIEVVEAEGNVSTETLIRRVARGGVGLAVAPENLAKLRSSYFDNVVVKPALGLPENVAWAVRANSPELLTTLNQWLAADSIQEKANALYEKYFVDRRGYQERVESEYLSSETGRLSEFDAILRRHAGEIGWDWRLLASQAYQESRFDSDARSWAGAQGLLQLMPGTAREVGVSNPNDPAQNVAGAVRHLQGLIRTWSDKIPDPAERLKFVLASYNVGTGHVQDAQRLTEKNGGDATRWDEVSYWLLQKSKKEVYSDPVVKHGFARGLEPVTYVARVLERFDHYRQFVQTGEG